jgi:hypothetical protein
MDERKLSRMTLASLAVGCFMPWILIWILNFADLQFLGFTGLHAAIWFVGGIWVIVSPFITAYFLWTVVVETKLLYRK